MKKILVTGASGQLGQCFQKYAREFPGLEFTFATSDDFDLCLFAVVGAYFRLNKFDYCINCGAYTNVEKAETEREMAFLVNSDAVKNLAEVCRQNGVSLVHFSTDYVFDGEKNSPYSEEDETNPINTYGASKLSGEQCIEKIMEEYFIFRTSWLYSEFGHNFFNTIKNRAKENELFEITTAQTGTPTNANDLAFFVLQLIAEGRKEYGIFHYSNLGEATWLDFAEEILKLSGMLGKVELVENNDYKTIAERPSYSVLDKAKALRVFQQTILPWRESLKQLF